MLKAIAAAVMFDNEVEIVNAPEIRDVFWLLEIIKKMGFSVDLKNGKIKIKRLKDDINTELDFDLAKRLRSSVVLMGPVLSKFASVKLPFPGGDKIGLRPIDLFLESFEKMGAKVKEEQDYISLSTNGRLKGAEIFFRNQSVTATESVMLAAALAEGETVLKNAAMEPEIVHLAKWINENGGNIEGAGTPFIKVKGVPALKASKAFTTPPDRIEAASFLALASVSASELYIKNCNPKELEAVLEYFSYIGLNFEVKENYILVKEDRAPSEFTMRDFKTHEYPGFPTDAQAPTVAALTQMSGEAQVFESIFNDRFSYVESLKLMGADIVQMDTRNILVRGPRKLKARPVRSPDIRAGLSYIIAASVAEGTTKIEHAYHIDRGYANIEKRLQKIGLKIKRIKE